MHTMDVVLEAGCLLITRVAEEQVEVYVGGCLLLFAAYECRTLLLMQTWSGSPGCLPSCLASAHSAKG